MARNESAQRNKILEAAMLAFAEKGLGGTSIREVGQAAGVNSALLYYYFENKHTLFVESARQVLRGFLESLLRQEQTFVHGRDRVAFLAEAIFDYYGAHPPRMRLLANILVGHPEVLVEVISGLVREKTAVPLEIIEAGMKCGQLKPGHPVQAWWSILGACMFSLQMREVVKESYPGAQVLPLPPMAQARRQIIDMLAGGMCAEKP